MERPEIPEEELQDDNPIEEDYEELCECGKKECNCGLNKDNLGYN